MTIAKIPRTTQVYVDADMQHAELLSMASGKVAVLCRRCPGRSQPNGDCAGILETDSGAIVLVVADGVGGAPMGHKASSIAVQSVMDQVARSVVESELRPAILDAIEAANRQILELGIGAATTMTVVEIQNQVARGYQVGDSSALIIGGRGALKWKSTSHSPVGYAVESGMLDEADALHHDELHVVSNLVGSRQMHIDIGPTQPLAPRDTVILGSDGLFDNLALAEVIKCGRMGKTVDRATAMAELATQRMTADDPGPIGKPDDFTVLIYNR